MRTCFFERELREEKIADVFEMMISSVGSLKRVVGEGSIGGKF